MPQKTYESHSETDNIHIAKNILAVCNNVRIFAFYGDLGAGKTTLIKRFCEYLGVKETVTSPTFTLVNEYAGEDSIVYHFDFYRIKTEIEAYDIGSEEYFDSGAYIFIEWPEKIPSLLPSDSVTIRL
ncbi:UNVERIFIED_CONTAM: hypothetical protein GTU68_035339, partial [Idotea baltica]|nr:hypothetical protein [Idotea baltica]